jgi:hypothetical protein
MECPHCILLKNELESHKSILNRIIQIIQNRRVSRVWMDIARILIKTGFIPKFKTSSEHLRQDVADLFEK